MTEIGNFILINKQTKQTACLPGKVNSLEIPKAYLKFIYHNAPQTMGMVGNGNTK